MGLFRFMPVSTQSVAQPSVASSSVKLMAVFGLALLGVGLCVGWLFGTRGARSSDMEPMSGPVLLAMQQIGQLHTVSFQMKDVVSQESQNEPEGWARDVPGMVSITHWATHNKALVIAEGSVEAGVDLRQIKETDVTPIKHSDGTTWLRVHLPPVTVYPPNVRVRVESSEYGPFWRDENIVPKAQAQASRRFQEAAEHQDIRGQAQKNALQMLTKMQRNFGSNHIEFTF